MKISSQHFSLLLTTVMFLTVTASSGLAQTDEQKLVISKAAKILEENSAFYDYAPLQNQLAPLANDGLPSAQYYYAMALEHKVLGSIKAAPWYRKSADNGYDKAQYKVGLFYKTDDPSFPMLKVPDRNIEAIRWFQMAAEQGHAPSQYELAHAHHRGKHIERSYKKAFDLYLKAANQGHLKAQIEVGKYYTYGHGMAEANGKEAIKWLEKAAASGDKEIIANARANAQALRSMAINFYTVGVELLQQKSLNDAFTNIKKSAELGHLDGQMTLVKLYSNGMGTKPDNQLAVNWLNAAAQQGHPLAQFELAKLYLAQNQPKIASELTYTAGKTLISAKDMPGAGVCIQMLEKIAAEKDFPQASKMATDLKTMIKK